VFEKTIKYADKFAASTLGGVNMRSTSAKDKIRNLRKVLESLIFTSDAMETLSLDSSEIAALMNLLPEDKDEAVALIPSLARLEGNIEEIIAQMHNILEPGY
jgi:hypothetical protein